MNYNHTIVLYHNNTRGQLQGTKIPLLRKRVHGFLPLFKYEDKERYYVISEDVVTESDEWIVERTTNYSPLLRYGDIFQLKNKKTGLYLSSYENEKSEQTKQGLMCLSQNPQLFYFQTTSVDEKIADIQHRSVVKIVNIENGLALHSHKDRYKNPKVKHMEVTAFKDKDWNDFWILEYRTHPLQIQYKIISSFQKITIRNQVEIKYLYEKAGELHPGSLKNSQVYELLSDKNNTLQIMNFKTQQYLDYIFKDGQDVTTFLLDLPLLGWSIIPLTEQTLVYGQPVHIVKNGRHLSLYKDRIALLLHPNIYSQWMIEQA